MDIEGILIEHGLWFVAAGTAISGDPVALTAGVLEQRGTFRFWPTVLAVAFGGWLSDLFLFLGGYYSRTTPAIARILDRPVAARLTERFLGRPVLLTLLFRLVPGSRTFVPLALGAGGTIGVPLYAAATATTCLVWAWVMIAVGHKIGDAIYAIWGRVREVETILVWPALAVAASLAVWIAVRRRRRVRADRDPPSPTGRGNS